MVRQARQTLDDVGKLLSGAQTAIGIASAFLMLGLWIGVQLTDLKGRVAHLEKHPSVDAHAEQDKKQDRNEFLLEQIDKRLSKLEMSVGALPASIRAEIATTVAADRFTGNHMWKWIRRTEKVNPNWRGADPFEDLDKAITGP